jgi:hypothetical protein
MEMIKRAIFIFLIAALTLSSSTTAFAEDNNETPNLTPILKMVTIDQGETDRIVEFTPTINITVRSTEIISWDEIVPIPNKTIYFYEEHCYYGHELLGTVVTDSNGYATFQYHPKERGRIGILMYQPAQDEYGEDRRGIDLNII